MTFPDSPLSRSLKARYFPRSDALHAKLGCSPSFTWRSILAGNTVLKDGCRWIIRNGRSVRIWDDVWVPDQRQLTPPPPHFSSFLQDFFWVRDLLDDMGSGWNHNLLFNIFPRETARCISSIYISPIDREDCLSWTPAKDGNYSVKTGYWVAKKLKDVASSNPSSSTNNPDRWKWFWKLHVPPKWRIFTWRCMRNSLPTCSALIHRGIPAPPLCSRCGLSSETPEHALRDCSWVRFLWEVSPLRLSVPQCIPFVSFQDWIIDATRGKPQVFSEIFISILWVIWKARNLVVFQQKILSHVDCLQLALSSLRDFQAANSTSQWHHLANPSVQPPLQPLVEWVSLFTDASINADGSAGFGGIFLDHSETPLHVFAKHHPTCPEVELAEGLACLEGIRTAVAEGIRALAVSLDSKTLVDSLGKKSPPITLGDYYRRHSSGSGRI